MHHDYLDKEIDDCDHRQRGQNRHRNVAAWLADLSARNQRRLEAGKGVDQQQDCIQPRARQVRAGDSWNRTAMRVNEEQARNDKDHEWHKFTDRKQVADPRSHLYAANVDEG